MRIHDLRATALKLFLPECSLPGRWERIGDRFAGCTILVEPVSTVSSVLEGRITVCPATMKKFGWREGDVKWKGIKKVDKNTFRCDDLYKEYDSESDMVLRRDYLATQLFFTGQHQIITATTTTYQKWRRISPPPKK